MGLEGPRVVPAALCTLGTSAPGGWVGWPSALPNSRTLSENPDILGAGALPWGQQVGPKLTSSTGNGSFLRQPHSSPDPSVRNPGGRRLAGELAAGENHPETLRSLAVGLQCKHSYPHARAGDSGFAETLGAERSEWPE